MSGAFVDGLSRSLAHLPARKQRQLRAVVDIIRLMADIEHVHLFGSHARGDWVEDFANGYISDFDLLVLVASPELAEDHALWAACQDRVRPLTADTPVSLIVHTVEDVNGQIERGSPFFRDVLSEGIPLYDAGRGVLPAITPLTPEQHIGLAQRWLGYYIDQAALLLSCFEGSLVEGRLRIAAFELHQTAEILYKAVLVVFEGYVPKTHNLAELGPRCIRMAPEIGALMPPDEPDGARLLALLTAAYVDARYSRAFQITQEELEILAVHVQALRARIERACRAELASLAAGLAETKARSS
jgi:predicted nucleotidyltransferase/HEPN domain-containing protein